MLLMLLYTVKMTITPNQKLLFCFRPESYVKLHRIEQCIPEMTSLKEEDAKWKLNIKHEPACALHIKFEMKLKKEPGCPVHTKSDVKIKKEPGCPVHTKSNVKLKKEPGCEKEKPMTHDPGYTPAHDLSDDGDGDVDQPEKIIRTEHDDSDGKTDDPEKCESEEKIVKKGEKIYVMIM